MNRPNIGMVFLRYELKYDVLELFSVWKFGSTSDTGMVDIADEYACVWPAQRERSSGSHSFDISMYNSHYIENHQPRLAAITTTAETCAELSGDL